MGPIGCTETSVRNYHHSLRNNPEGCSSQLLCGEILKLCKLPRWRSWLRHCATSQKVAGSIPDGVIGIFHWHNPSGRTVGLGSTQPLTEMSTGNISWGGKGGRYVGLTTLPPSCADCLEIWGASTCWNPLGLSSPVMGLLYLFICYPSRIFTKIWICSKYFRKNLKKKNFMKIRPVGAKLLHHEDGRTYWQTWWT